MYYSTNEINQLEATYNIIFGERSNGKTYALLHQSIENYTNDGSQFAYVRRWKEDITGRRAGRLFGGINENQVVESLTDGEFSGVHYYSGKYYLCTYDDAGKAIYNDSNILGYCFSLSDGEHDKSTSFPSVRTIIFDEFLTNRLYLPDEFVLFMNTVSTIVRRRTDVKIYMLGNTVNKYCPYFSEMGLDKIPQMKQGTIDTYSYGESKLIVAVEYCKTTNDGKNTEQNKYFAFNNPKLQMITGGSWELNIYPHLPMKYKPKDVMLTYYIMFNGATYQCEVISKDDVKFTYIKDTTSDIKDVHFIYSLDQQVEANYNRSIYKPTNTIQSKIVWFFNNDKVFYQDNNIGDAISNYLKVAKTI